MFRHPSRCPQAIVWAGGAPAVIEPPNIDLTLLAFDDRQRLLAAANLLLSRDHPEGLIVGLSDDLKSRSVLWQLGLP
ncbi:MAG: hypothetical protein QM522_02465 [Chitinophagaceae bacterium]|nr:hypothetical protein [Chitinophagaceae bacterium]